MITVDVRKQGGAAVMTIPADLLKMLNVEIGSKLRVDIRSGALVAKPVTTKKSRKRYTLPELLQGTTPEVMHTLNKKTAWARAGAKKGRELA